MRRFVSTRVATAVITGAALSLGTLSALADDDSQPGNYQDHVVPQPNHDEADRTTPDSTEANATRDRMQPGTYQSHRVPDPNKYKAPPDDVRHSDTSGDDTDRDSADNTEQQPDRPSAPNNAAPDQ